MTTKDVEVAERIFGPDIGALKGQTTRQRPPVVWNDNVAIPNKIKEKIDDLVLCMNIMYVNGMPMLTSVDKKIKYKGLVPLENWTSDEMYLGLDKILQLYNDADYVIKEI